MNLNSETTVKDIALSSPAARHVLEEAGVDYCCGGGKSLHDACLHAGVSEQALLDRLRQNTKATRPEDANWQTAPLHELTQHIRDRHHSYVRAAISRTQALLDKVLASHGRNHPEVAEIGKLFMGIRVEMIAHMQKEEKILFPYIDALEQASETKVPVEPPFFQTVKKPIHMMMEEHDSSGELVRQIRKASDDYQPPADACTTFRAAYQELEQFEKDLHLHVHLENNILFPRAVALEDATR
jgi:regulator of cell morphogenesis and NO signaling